MKKKFIIPEMEILLFDENEIEVTLSGEGPQKAQAKRGSILGVDTSVDMAGDYLEQKGVNSANVTVEDAKSIF